MTLGWIIGANVLSGVVAVWIAAAVLVVRREALPRLVPRLVDFATGTLLGAAFLGLLPAALADASGPSVQGVLLAVLLGVLGFVTYERLLAWRHCHRTGCPAHEAVAARGRATVPLVLAGDGVHNLLDGVVIAAAFSSGPTAGVATTVAVLAHEVPQEVGDIGVLIRSGLSPRRALFYNSLCSLTSIAGGIAGYFALAWVEAVRPYALAISAATFLYIALTDLVPSMHEERPEGRSVLRQLALVGAGVGTTLLLRSVANA